MKESHKKARQVLWVGFVANLVLTVLKIFAGIIARSSAMVADGVHSVSDLATDIVVLGSLQVSQRPRDHNHHYGHGKVETLATAFVGLALIVVGIGLLYTGGMKIYTVYRGEFLPRPGMLALYAAVSSIVIKEILFRYTIIAGRKANSQAVIANAWHHRSDVYSSIGTLLGISGAIFFGDEWVILDPVAAVIVSFFIFSIALKITKESLFELIETSLPKEQETEILNIINSFNIKDPHNFKTRKIGNHIAIDVHIRVNKNMNIVEAHQITKEIEIALREKYGQDTFISIHPEPILID